MITPESVPDLYGVDPVRLVAALGDLERALHQGTAVQVALIGRVRDVSKATT